jgi:hypothetical protein
MYKFPAALSVSLHVPADAEERQRWMAEMDLDPSSDAKIVVCSLHFRDGLPSARGPNPTQMLREGEEKESFSAETETLKKKSDGEPMITDSWSELKIEKRAPNKSSVFVQIVTGKKRKTKRKWKRPRLRVSPKNECPLERSRRKILLRAVKNRLGARIACRSTGKLFESTRNYFEHFLDLKVRKGEKEKPNAVSEESRMYDEDEESELVIDLDAGRGEKEKKMLRIKLKQADEEEDNHLALTAAAEFMTQIRYPAVSSLNTEERAKYALALYPPQPLKTMNARKKYVCAVW